MAFFGICYSPLRIDAGAVTEGSVDFDMQAIKSRGFTNVRTYSASGPNKWNVDKAVKHGLKLGLGVWVDADPAKTRSEIQYALMSAQNAAKAYNVGRVSLDLVVGNEVDRPEAHTDPGAVLAAMKFANVEKQKTDYADVAARVTTCFSGSVLKDHPEWQSVVDSCDEVVYLTVYPWWAQADNVQVDPANIAPQMEWSYTNCLKLVEDSNKRVVIAEIGWPGAGVPNWGTTVDNERINYAATTAWVSGSNFINKAFDTYWFEMFDEAWKTAEGGQGPHWGLYTGGANPQPKF